MRVFPETRRPAARIRVSTPSNPAQRVPLPRLLGIVLFNFVAYFCVGLPLAVIPAQVHVTLGFGTVLAGLAVSVQYVATLSSRPVAGRLCDVRGPKHSVRIGLGFCAASGALMLAAALAVSVPAVSLALLLLARLPLGVGESLVTTGTTLWGIGTVGSADTARAISWNGITSYGALALGAPVGVWLDGAVGFSALGLLMLAVALGSLWLAGRRPGVATAPGVRLPARAVFGRMWPFGTCLGLGSVGFGAITAFAALYFLDRHWAHAALAITALGTAFVLTRLLAGNAVVRFGGYRVAMASFFTEAAGLALVWLAPGAGWAVLGAAITGVGFSLVFPALGMEAVKQVPAANRGSALGLYSVFLDVALGITGPLAGWLAHRGGYGDIYPLASAAAIAALLASALLWRRALRPSAGA